MSAQRLWWCGLDICAAKLNEPVEDVGREGKGFLSEDRG